MMHRYYRPVLAFVLITSVTSFTVPSSSFITSNRVSYNQAVAETTATQRRRIALRETVLDNGDLNINDDDIVGGDAKKIVKRSQLRQTPYQRWQDDTLEWIMARPVGALPDDVLGDTSDIIKGWVGGSLKTTVPPNSGNNKEVGFLPLLEEKLRRAENAEQLLRRLILEREAGNKAAASLPTPKNFQMVIEGWALVAYWSQKIKNDRKHQEILSSISPSARAKSMLELMKSSFLFPTGAMTQSYNALVHAYAWNGEPEMADEVLREMEQEFANALQKNDDPTETSKSNSHMERTIVKPITSGYNVVISSYVKNAAYPLNADRISSLLGRISHQYVDLKNRFAKPTSFSYTSAIALYASNGNCEDAERLLNELEIMWESSDHNKGLCPDTITYNTVMSAWAANPSKTGIKSANHTQAILDRMKNNYQNKINTKCKPNLKSMNAVILAWAKCSPSAIKSSHAAEMAEQTLDYMLDQYRNYNQTDMKPNARTYTTVINAWGRTGNSKNAAKKAEEILNRMEEDYQITNDSEMCKPNARSYTAVLDAYAWNYDGRDRAVKAEQILARMEQKWREDHDENVKPDVRSYNAVLNAWSNNRTPDAGPKSELILSRMEEMYLSKENVKGRPDSYSYNAVITAYGRGGGANAAENADRILTKMENSYVGGNKNARPIRNNYNSVLISYSNSIKPQQAVDRIKQIINTMEDLNKQGRKRLTPDKITYRALIDAISKTDDILKAEKSQEILEKMKVTDNCQPDIPVYNSVLNACANHPVFDDQYRQKAFLIAQSIFVEMNENPNLKIGESVYSFFLHACAKLLPKGEEATDQIVGAVFKKCCSVGMVSDRNLAEVKSVASDELFASLMLLGGYSVEDDQIAKSENGDEGQKLKTLIMNKLPKEWSRNARKKFHVK